MRANRAVIALGDGGISFYNAASSTPLIIDVVGWFSDATAVPDIGGATRVLDTRTHIGGSGAAFPVAVVGNLTAVAPTAKGYLTAFPRTSASPVSRSRTLQTSTHRR